jgi:hypothetical protein
MSLDAQRFVYNGRPVYNRHSLISCIAKQFSDENSFDIVLETVRILENAGIIETDEALMSTVFVVQNWEKML